MRLTGVADEDLVVNTACKITGDARFCELA
jgi:hypothetical protein